MTAGIYEVENENGKFLSGDSSCAIVGGSFELISEKAAEKGFECSEFGTGCFALDSENTDTEVTVGDDSDSTSHDVEDTEFVASDMKLQDPNKEHDEINHDNKEAQFVVTHNIQNTLSTDSDAGETTNETELDTEAISDPITVSQLVNNTVTATVNSENKNGEVLQEKYIASVDGVPPVTENRSADVHYEKYYNDDSNAVVEVSNGEFEPTSGDNSSNPEVTFDDLQGNISADKNMDDMVSMSSMEVSSDQVIEAAVPRFGDEKLKDPIKNDQLQLNHSDVVLEHTILKDHNEAFITANMEMDGFIEDMVVETDDSSPQHSKSQDTSNVIETVEDGIFNHDHPVQNNRDTEVNEFVELDVKLQDPNKENIEINYDKKESEFVVMHNIQNNLSINCDAGETVNETELETEAINDPITVSQLVDKTLTEAELEVKETSVAPLLIFPETFVSPELKIQFGTFGLYKKYPNDDSNAVVENDSNPEVTCDDLQGNKNDDKTNKEEVKDMDDMVSMSCVEVSSDEVIEVEVPIFDDDEKIKFYQMQFDYYEDYYYEQERLKDHDEAFKTANMENPRNEVDSLDDNVSKEEVATLAITNTFEEEKENEKELEAQLQVADEVCQQADEHSNSLFSNQMDRIMDERNTNEPLVSDMGEKVAMNSVPIQTELEFISVVSTTQQHKKTVLSRDNQTKAKVARKTNRVVKTKEPSKFLVTNSKFVCLREIMEDEEEEEQTVVEFDTEKKIECNLNDKAKKMRSKKNERKRTSGDIVKQNKTKKTNQKAPTVENRRQCHKWWKMLTVMVLTIIFFLYIIQYVQ